MMISPRYSRNGDDVSRKMERGCILSVERLCMDFDMR